MKQRQVNQKTDCNWQRFFIEKSWAWENLIHHEYLQKCYPEFNGSGDGGTNSQSILGFAATTRYQSARGKGEAWKRNYNWIRIYIICFSDCISFFHPIPNHITKVSVSGSIFSPPVPPKYHVIIVHRLSLFCIKAHIPQLLLSWQQSYFWPTNYQKTLPRKKHFPMFLKQKILMYSMEKI